MVIGQSMLNDLREGANCKQTLIFSGMVCPRGSVVCPRRILASYGLGRRQAGGGANWIKS